MTLLRQRHSAARTDYHQRRVEHEKLDGYGWTMSLDSVRTPEEILLVKQQFERLEANITKLPARIERVMRLRLGINCKPLTFEAIAEQYGVTRERIRQMENKGLCIIKRRIWIEEKPEDYRREQENVAKAYAERRRLEREAELAKIKANAERERVAAEERLCQRREPSRPRAADGKFTSYLPNRYRTPPQAPPHERTILDDIVTEQKRTATLEREYKTWAAERQAWLNAPMPDWATIKPYLYKMRHTPIKRDWLHVATEGFRDGA